MAAKKIKNLTNKIDVQLLLNTLVEMLRFGGYMSASGVGELVIVEDTMDQYKYIEILKNHLQAITNKMDLDQNYIFQQDNGS